MSLLVKDCGKIRWDLLSVGWRPILGRQVLFLYWNPRTMYRRIRRQKSAARIRSTALIMPRDRVWKNSGYVCIQSKFYYFNFNHRFLFLMISFPNIDIYIYISICSNPILEDICSTIPKEEMHQTLKKSWMDTLVSAY